MSCSIENSIPDFLPKIYKLDIKQGNEIDSEMLLKLKPAMTMSQVKFVLGTPLILDSFHKQRWDYLYVLRRDGKIIEKRHVIINFEKDLLKNITGEVVPENKNRHLENKEKLDDLGYEQDESDDVKSSWLEKIKFWKQETAASDGKEVSTKAIEILDEDNLPNNVDFIQKIDVTESMNEAVRADIENNESGDLSGDNLNNKKAPSEDKDVIINPKTDGKDSDYFKLLLEKIGF
jgi:outer membrane protein assembly factor BamE